MATQFEIDCALMAGRAYQTTRDPINQFSVPQGWTEFFHVPNNPNFPEFTGASGFEAVAFQRTTNPNEIVISFAGTEPLRIADWSSGNVPLALGFVSDQFRRAVDYYLQVRRDNPNANIIFTGHSLGGGIAALMGVFFGKQAITFNQAPFANTARQGFFGTASGALDVELYLIGRSYADPAMRAVRDVAVADQLMLSTLHSRVVPFLEALARSITVFLFLFVPAAAAAQFEIVRGDDQVCISYKKSLEALDERTIAPLICERPLKTEFGLTNPSTKDLDLSDNRDLYKDVLRFLRSASNGTLSVGQEFEDLIAHERKFNRLKEYSQRLDIRNVGVPARLVSFRDGRCTLPGDSNSRNYQTTVLILSEDGKSIDRAAMAPLSSLVKRRHSTMQVFNYRSATYLDFWASAEVYRDRNVLHIYKVNNKKLSKVCELSYEGSLNAIPQR